MHYLYSRICNYENPLSPASQYRKKRITLLLVGLLREIRSAHGSLRVADVGGTADYWNMLPSGLLDELDAQITLINLPGSQSAPTSPRFSILEADACSLGQIPDLSFDLVHSNSVIEHVGGWQRMCEFAGEARRLAPNVFVQTPYFWFPLEPHFMTPCFHWLPLPLRVFLLEKFSLGYFPKAGSLDQAMRYAESAQLLSEGMLRALFPDCEIHKERALCLTKSLLAIRKSDRLYTHRG